MSNRHPGYLPSDATEGDAVIEEAYDFVHHREIALASAGDSRPLSAAEREQLDREIAAIERASAALRRGDPELETWTDTPVVAGAPHQPRPVWFLIGVLWLSTALVTVGAVFAISALIG